MSNPTRCIQTLAVVDADHRCPACVLVGDLQRLRDQHEALRRERTRLADEVIALSARAALAEEERNIAARRAARAVEERDAMIEREFQREQVEREQAESLQQAEWTVAQLRMVGAI